MTSLPLNAAAPAPSLAHPVPKLLLAAAVALVGDRLFYDHDLGISLVLFLALVAAASLAVGCSRRPRPGGRTVVVALLVLIAGLAPLTEAVGALSLAFGIAGLALAVAILIDGPRQGVRAGAASAGRLLVTGPFDLPPDLYRVARRAAGAGGRPQAAAVLGWLVPVGLCAVFAGLFSTANPLFAGWISDIPWSALIPGFDLPRNLLWLALLAFVWAFVAPRMRARSRATSQVEAPPAGEPAAAMPRALLDPATVLRCLVLFNLLFAVQTATDVAYLWAGLSLPDGMNYAAYAHRGAYPLLVTALLAAAFVLVALRPGGAGERSTAIRVLVCLWIGQNVLLVISAMRRLDLYVEVYGLSVLRLSALIWMGLVAVGLALVLARILLHRGNGWLVRANSLTLAATLYACAFVNFTGVVADFNAARRFDAGQAFDLAYAMSLGAGAIPAVDRILAADTVPPPENVVLWRKVLVWNLEVRMRDWRAWTFRDRRLLDYLEAHPDAPSPTR